MRRTLVWVLGAVGGLGLSSIPVHAGTQTILGHKIKSSASASGKRTFIGLAKESASPNAVVGDPIANGAALRIILNGAAGRDATFLLPAGAYTSGGAGWKSICGGCGFQYADPRSLNGPVKKCLIKRSSSGAFQLKCQLKAALDVGTDPPGTGTDGGMVLTITGGDQYCVGLGGAAGGSVANTAASFKMTKATAEPGCPVAVCSGSAQCSGDRILPPEPTKPPPTCGDGVCNGSENGCSCSLDCPTAVCRLEAGILAACDDCSCATQHSVSFCAFDTHQCSAGALICVATDRDYLELLPNGTVTQCDTTSCQTFMVGPESNPPTYAGDAPSGEVAMDDPGTAATGVCAP